MLALGSIEVNLKTTIKPKRPFLTLIGSMPFILMGLFHLKNGVWFAYVELSLAFISMSVTLGMLLPFSSYVEVKEGKIVIRNLFIKRTLNIDELSEIKYSSRAIYITLLNPESRSINKITYQLFNYNYLIQDIYKLPLVKIVHAVNENKT
ncbi:hypothetical protein GCE9029_00811 [Grimontia celer]|uniref:Uncharacterized protein n=1 Tax=Grimontia celer TaxID=1796497 RepID=A0A128EWK1_9GAMM|nr:hypothetical protein GCE9029_00811 [Grimontia celer]